jgi:hypothetical protein
MNPDDLEEPVPCEECRQWVELQEIQLCLGCRKLLCRECRRAFWGMCATCEAQRLAKEKP